jgi:hypothetical protein
MLIIKIPDCFMEPVPSVAEGLARTSKALVIARSREFQIVAPVRTRFYLVRSIP